MAAFFGSLAGVVFLTLRSSESSSTRAEPTRTASRPRRLPRRRPPSRPAPKKPVVRKKPIVRPHPLVRLLGVGAYDPKGDQHEKDDLVARASDGDRASYWTTETYATWGWKPGVGLVLDARRPVCLTQLTLLSDTPGFTAQIQAGSSPDGPFTPVSARRSAGRTTVFRLVERAPKRYCLVWITQLAPEPTKGGSVHVNEVRAR